MGKTFVALGAVQRRAQSRPRHQRKVLVICPAQLESVWHDASRDQGVALDTESMETLGNTTGADTSDRLRQLEQYAIVIVDEAHNFRNPLANRFTNLMRILQGGPADKEVLLLTATPINNSIGDLYSLYRLMIRDDDAFFQSTNLRMPSLREFFKRIEKGEAATTDLLLETMVCRSRLDIRRRQDAGRPLLLLGKKFVPDAPHGRAQLLSQHHDNRPHLRSYCGDHRILVPWSLQRRAVFLKTGPASQANVRDTPGHSSRSSC